MDNLTEPVTCTVCDTDVPCVASVREGVLEFTCKRCQDVVYAVQLTGGLETFSQFLVDDLVARRQETDHPDD
ncbi:MAG: hypothetical protein ACYCW6_22240, partial [Candidatus Xenobia bacterium]